MTCLLCDHPRSTHTPQCRTRLGVDLRDMTRYTQCLCPGFEAGLCEVCGGNGCADCEEV
ncbi:hypothetical protein SEA_RIALTO_78 [Mycobacterium phage Rialto]|uniref:Uncharacterized protein n=1 Tax=Mycobacterium phage ShiLan TaxID=1036616 RepID=G1DUR7_9CAUD|nr:hypothetical protein FDI15_gp073 [Mycobacterium phage ShiLan]AEJ93257.1 hypothetical protein SHILAN_73 [Mycobacterium phage ShiLan]WNM65642.1 hypothetical protein SEA_RIALTO_78 [Mycobacterium phage Rialto]